jgi:hypothetical protein
MATLAQLRSQALLAEARLQLQLTRVRSELIVLECIYRRRPLPLMASAFGVGWVSAFWLTPALLIGGALRIAFAQAHGFGRRTLRRALL